MSKIKLIEGQLYEVRVHRKDRSRTRRITVQVLSKGTEGHARVLNMSRNFVEYITLSKIHSVKELAVRKAELAEYEVQEKPVKIMGEPYV